MATQKPETTVDPDRVSAQPHELEYLARKHGTTVDRVMEVIRETGSRSRDQIEAALHRKFQPWWLPVMRLPKDRSK